MVMPDIYDWFVITVDCNGEMHIEPYETVRTAVRGLRAARINGKIAKLAKVEVNYDEEI